MIITHFFSCLIPFIYMVIFYIGAIFFADLQNGSWIGFILFIPLSLLTAALTLGLLNFLFNEAIPLWLKETPIESPRVLVRKNTLKRLPQWAKKAPIIRTLMIFTFIFHSILSIIILLIIQISPITALVGNGGWYYLGATITLVFIFFAYFITYQMCHEELEISTDSEKAELLKRNINYIMKHYNIQNKNLDIESKYYLYSIILEDLKKRHCL